MSSEVAEKGHCGHVSLNSVSTQLCPLSGLNCFAGTPALPSWYCLHVSIFTLISDLFLSLSCVCKHLDSLKCNFLTFLALSVNKNGQTTFKCFYVWMSLIQTSVAHSNFFKMQGCTTERFWYFLMFSVLNQLLLTTIPGWLKSHCPPESQYKLTSSVSSEN